MNLRPSALFTVVAAAALLTSACGGPPAAQSTSGPGAPALTVHDAAGRTVTFDAPPQRVVFGEQRQAYASMVLDKKNPTDKVVAWGSDMERAAPDLYSRLAKVHPAVQDIPKIGSVNAGDLTVESLLAHKPDVYVMTLDSMRAAEKNGLLTQLDQAGIRYVVTDFRIDPAKNTDITMRALGQVLGKERAAEDFLAYYHGIVDPILAESKAATNRPTTFMWRAPGVKACCSTWKDVNFGQMLEAAGGTNIADSLLGGEEGDLTPEQVVASDPKLVVATGGAWSKQKFDPKAKTSYLSIGYDVPKEQAVQSLKNLQQQPGFENLQAFRAGNVHGVYHQFYDAPFNFIAYQAFAKWQQPQQFSKVDPEKTWKDFSAKYLPFPAEGTVAVSLR